MKLLKLHVTAKKAELNGTSNININITGNALVSRPLLGNSAICGWLSRLIALDLSCGLNVWLTKSES